MASNYFIGLSIPGNVAAKLTATMATLSEQFPALAWTPPENLHITLMYLGLDN